MKRTISALLLALCFSALPFVAAADDSDHDTLPDDWETKHGRNPHHPDYQVVAAGWYFNCARDDAGVECWGDNYYGNTDVPPLKNPRLLSVQHQDACVLDDIGVHCWGNNEYGQDNVPPLKNPVFVSAGPRTAGARDDDGVHFWGEPLNPGAPAPPREFPAFAGPKQIAFSSGGEFICVLDSVDVYCRGGNDEWGVSSSPTLSHPTQLTAGYTHACALDDTGVHCWGANDFGQTTVPALVKPVQVSAGGYHTCALDKKGVHCWGNDDLGVVSGIPVLDHPVQIAVSIIHACALDKKGVKCWGEFGAAPDLKIDPDDDGFNNNVDAFPLDSLKHIDPRDRDGDGIKNHWDVYPDDPTRAGDRDKDGIDRLVDNCRHKMNEDQADLDGDGIGDVCDRDRDGDGFNNGKDLFTDDRLQH